MFEVRSMKIGGSKIKEKLGFACLDRYSGVNTAFFILFVPDIDSPDKYLSNDVLPGGASKSAHPSEGHCGLILAPTGDNFFPLKD